MRYGILSLLCVGVATSSVCGADALPKPVPLVNHYVADYPKINPLPGNLPFTKAVKANITQIVDEPWKVRILQRLPSAVKKDDLLVVEFWTKAFTSGAKLYVQVQERRSPWRPSAKGSVEPGDDWQHVVIAGKAIGDFPANELELVVSLGYGKQILGFSDIEVDNYGHTAISPEDALKQLQDAANTKK